MPLLRGNLSFKGFGQEASKNVPYLIISSTNQEKRQPKNDGAGDCNDAGGGNSGDSDHDDIMTSACRAWKHMRKDLKLSQPKLMISVTGGAKRFEMKKRHLKSFKRGLMKAATTSNAWIITGGTKNGVMEFVGDAVKEFMLENGAYEQGLVVLGIATLGAVSHCEDLIRQCSEQDATPVTPYAYSPPNQPQGKKALLDPHHTHFILVDDGTRDSFGKEIAFRAAYEQHDHELTTAVNSDCDICGVPVVMLVLEGGINTLQTACEAIEKNTPVIVMQGSGRAADFVVRAQSFIESGDEEGLRLESLTLVSESDIDKAVRFTKTLLHPSRRHLMTVFQHNEDTSGDELAEAILKALLRASLNSSRLTKQATSDFLALALSFNRCDIAKKEILNLEKKSELFNPSILNDPFMTALTENKFDFVQFFLDLGVELKSFFDYGKLNLIYRHALLNASSGSSVEVMKCIIYDVTNGKLPESILPAVRRTVNSLTEDQFVDLYKGVRMDELLENPERELFFWCILLNYQEMARIFWRAGIDYIGGALTASRIMSSLSLVALKRMEEFELSRQLNEEASKYEDEAKCILNECYDCNPELAKNLMVRNLSTWGNRTLFDLANDARLMDFSEHDCCQAKLNYIWYGRMKSHTSPWMVILGLFLPLVVVRFIEFRDADDSNHVVPLDDEESFSSTTSSASSSSSSSKFEFLRKRSSNISLLKMRTRSSRCCGRFFGNLCSFFAAPFVKFGYYTISYLVLLSIFSYFVMIELQPVQVSILEIVTWIWMIIRCLDEFRQLLMCDAPTLRLKFSRYFSDPWNIYDLVINTFIVLAIILRFELDGERFGAVRILYSLTLLLCILRLLKLFYIHQYVGPKVIMIQKVMFDLMFFVLIFGVFLFSYGVAAQSLLYPNSEPTWHVLMKIVYQPYFTLFGQFNLEELLGKVPNCVTNQTLYQSDPFNYPLCSQYSWMALLLFSVYAIMVCTMLVNLLVAIFSFTFTSIQETALKTWQFHRIATIREFSEKPTLAPPFIIISHIFMIIGLICSCRKKRQPIRNEFRMEYEDIQNRRLGALERKGMENHLINKKVQLKTDNNFMVKSTSEKTEVIVGHLENIREFLNKKSMRRSKINSNNTAMEKAQKVKSQEKQKKFEILNERMNRFEDELEKQTTKLDAIVKLLQDKMMQ